MGDRISAAASGEPSSPPSDPFVMRKYSTLEFAKDSSLRVVMLLSSYKSFREIQGSKELIRRTRMITQTKLLHQPMISSFEQKREVEIEERTADES
jgi:hypothetical protein